MHAHMTNTLNTPVEALEYAYPFIVTEYSIRRGTGGKGKHRGGDGMVREIKLLAEAEATVLSERRVRGPYGVQGGEAGTPGRNVVVRNGDPIELPGKIHLKTHCRATCCVSKPRAEADGARKNSVLNYDLRT